jgi:hypothetical protein
MHGEDLIRKDPLQLSGFLRQFCTQTLPWYYLNRLERQTYTETASCREVAFSRGVVTHLDDRDYYIRQNHRLLLRNGDVFIPALWMEQPAIIAYSTDGYPQPQEWELPADWSSVAAVDMSRLTPDGLQPGQENRTVRNGKLSILLHKDEALLIRPAGEKKHNPVTEARHP